MSTSTPHLTVDLVFWAPIVASTVVFCGAGYGFLGLAALGGGIRSVRGWLVPLLVCSASALVTWFLVTVLLRGLTTFV